MDDQRVTARKVFATEFALVILLGGVARLNVIPQIAPLSKMTATMAAFVRFIAAVQSLVHLQRRTGKETLSTDFALMRTFAGVR